MQQYQLYWCYFPAVFRLISYLENLKSPELRTTTRVYSIQIEERSTAPTLPRLLHFPKVPWRHPIPCKLSSLEIWPKTRVKRNHTYMYTSWLTWLLPFSKNTYILPFPSQCHIPTSHTFYHPHNQNSTCDNHNWIPILTWYKNLININTSNYEDFSYNLKEPKISFNQPRLCLQVSVLWHTFFTSNSTEIFETNLSSKAVPLHRGDK